ncbi:MAG TPA: CRTAC1 family protein [Planctomycetes bacterium]|nr:CRTAC1 family protein [Planctomycetota bacterium]
MNKYHQIARRIFWAIVLGVSFYPAHTNATFEDRSTQLGLALTNGPAAWGDYDNDGWVDLYAAGALWRNNEGKNFTKVMGKGAGIWGDYNNDGYLDLFVLDGRQILRNNQKGAFIPISLPEFPKSVIRGANWADYDGDGYVDLYVGGYETWPSSSYPDVILRNDGGAGFSLKWTQSEPIHRARGVTSCDFDNDGDMDVYVSNYRLQANLLWLNDGTGRFENAAKEFGVDGDYNGHQWSYGHSIGSAWGDIDEDGYIDLFVGNFSHPPAHQDRCKFYKNTGPDGKYHFQDMSETASVGWQESYASPALGDYDNDGDLDLYLTTVYAVGSGGIRNYPVLYRNEGKWRFTDVTSEEGLAKLSPTYQAAWADFDNDGDPDLVTAGRLFVNMTKGNNWIKVRPAGDGKNVNSAAIGAQVRIRIRDKTITRQVEAGTGEGNQNDMTLHFGLGKWDVAVATVEIAWPNGVVQKIHKVSVNSLLEIRFKK